MCLRLENKAQDLIMYKLQIVINHIWKPQMNAKFTRT